MTRDRQLVCFSAANFAQLLEPEEGAVHVRIHPLVVQGRPEEELLQPFFFFSLFFVATISNLMTTEQLRENKSKNMASRTTTCGTATS